MTVCRYGLNRASESLYTIKPPVPAVANEVVTESNTFMPPNSSSTHSIAVSPT